MKNTREETHSCLCVDMLNFFLYTIMSYLKEFGENIYFAHMGVLPAQMSVYHMTAISTEVREGVGFPGT